MNVYLGEPQSARQCSLLLLYFLCRRKSLSFLNQYLPWPFLSRLQPFSFVKLEKEKKKKKKTLKLVCQMELK